MVVEEKKKNSKGILSFIIKLISVCGVVLLLAYIIIFGMLDSFLNDYNWEQRDINDKENYYINDKHRIGGMVAYGEDGLSVTPIDAYIQNGMIYVKAKLVNNTGKNLAVRDFGVVTANATTVPFATDFDNAKTLNNNSSMEITFNFGAYDVMMNDTDYPNTISFELGTDSNNNYYEFDLVFNIGWRYNNYYN